MQGTSAHVKPRGAFSKQSNAQKGLKPSDSFDSYHHSLSLWRGGKQTSGTDSPEPQLSPSDFHQLLCSRRSPESHSPGIKLWHTLELKWFAKITVMLLCSNSCDIILPQQMDFLYTKKTPRPGSAASLVWSERALLEGSEQLSAPAP